MATLEASTAGGRSGRLATFGASWMLLVCEARLLSSVQVSRNLAWYGWSWKLRMSSPSVSASRDSVTTWRASAAAGVMNTPNCRLWP